MLAQKLDQERAKLDELLAQNRVNEYNQGVNSFNAQVGQYNNLIQQRKSLIAQHNKIVGLYNEVASTEAELVDLLKTDVQQIEQPLN